MTLAGYQYDSLAAELFFFFSISSFPLLILSLGLEKTENWP